MVPPRFRLLLTGRRDGAWNMAVDEAVTQAVGAGAAPPTLRLYGWDPPCLSLGRFQRYASEVDPAACQIGGVDIVRRPSGGRLLLHEREVTYSLIAPLTNQLAAGSVTATYARISQALLAGLRQLGVAAELAGRARRDQPARGRFGACFDTPSDYEVVVAGRKLIGSAQWRHAGALLQHGAVLLRAEPARLYAFARPPTGLTAAEATAHLAPRLTDLETLFVQARAGTPDASIPPESAVTGGRPAPLSEPTFEIVAEALVAGFVEALAIEVVAGDLSNKEQSVAEWLWINKYRTAAWTIDRREPTSGWQEFAERPG